jgi:hypothetical protein
MASAYPGALDTLVDPISTDTLDSGTVPHAAEHGNANRAIVAVETTLGVSPQGGSATVVARLNANDTAVALKAPLASPTFTGTVTIPTGAQVATPNITGAVTAPAVAAKAPLASPTFTGTVTIPTGAQVATPNITGAVTAPAVADSADGYGYVGTPQVSTAVNLTVLLAHMGKDIYVTATGKTITIDSNANLALQIGSGFTVTNDTGVTTSIAITTDTLVLANSASTGTRTLAPYGVAVFKKVTATKWICSGNGLT